MGTKISLQGPLQGLCRGCITQALYRGGPGDVVGWLVGWLYDTGMAAGGSPPGESSRRAYAASADRGGVLRPCLPTTPLSCPHAVWRARPDCCLGPLLPTISPLPSEPLLPPRLYAPAPAVPRIAPLTGSSAPSPPPDMNLLGPSLPTPLTSPSRLAPTPAVPYHKLSTNWRTTCAQH